MKRIFHIVTAVIVFLNVGLVDSFALELEPVQMEKTIGAAVNWLQQSQESNGHFRYEYMPFLDRYIQDDHIVRQAGTVFVLSEAMRRDEKNHFALKDSVRSSLTYLDTNSTDQLFNNYQFRCLKLNENQCTLGGTSLALIAYINLVKKYPELTNKYSDLIEKNLNFIMAMRLPGKGFRGSFYLNADQTETESDFYNGEALLALTYYYQYNPDEKVKKNIDESVEYFDKFYSADWNNNFYLWGMAALKNLYLIEPKESYYKFVKDYTDWRILGYKDKRNTDRNVCAYLEGIVSAFSVIQTKPGDTESYLEEINFWLNQSRNLQIKKGDKMSVQINKAKTKKVALKNPNKSIGGFLTSLSEPVQRIDFTQHCLNSFMQKYEDVDGNEM